MISKKGTLFLFLFSVLILFGCSKKEITVVVENESTIIMIGTEKLESSLNQLGYIVNVINQSEAGDQPDIIVQLITENAHSTIKEEGFITKKSDGTIIIEAVGEKGAQYGLLDLAEQVQMKDGLKGVVEKEVNPRFNFRAIKFNLPWNSYRENPALQANMELCKDLNMWESFLDMMVENRFNKLTLWNLHPFPYLIRAENFPDATPFSDEELAEWKTFWTKLFKMAKDRGIETYLLNWNVIVSQSFVDNYGEGQVNFWADGYTSAQIEKYTKESVTQVINEYPNLTGLGITMGEAMQGWTGKQETAWMDRTFFAGMREADRKIKFIYRAALDGDHNPHRNAIDSCGFGTPETPIIVELKFNWSHAHSSTTLVKAHGGGTGSEYWTDPAPTHHKMAWMIRNEDFFRLRWGQPDFIREHIEVNGHDYVGGYFVGSECYIPAKDIFHKPNHSHVNWDYAFERQWLYYKQWGRLLYDASTSDAVFANAFNQRFSDVEGSKMVDAYKLSTKTTQRIAQFFNFTWDHTFYTEGFIGGKWNFITIEEMRDSNPIEPNFVSVKEFGDGSEDFGSKITPLELASMLEKDNNEALEIANSITTENETLKCELADVKAWSYMGLYFAKKIRAAVALNQGNKEASIGLLYEAQKYWGNLSEVTDDHIQPSFLANLNGDFHWKNFQKLVADDIEWVENYETK